MRNVRGGGTEIVSKLISAAQVGVSGVQRGAYEDGVRVGERREQRKRRACEEDKVRVWTLALLDRSMLLSDRAEMPDASLAQACVWIRCNK